MISNDLYIPVSILSLSKEGKIVCKNMENDKQFTIDLFGEREDLNQFLELISRHVNSFEIPSFTVISSVMLSSLPHLIDKSPNECKIKNFLYYLQERFKDHSTFPITGKLHCWKKEDEPILYLTDIVIEECDECSKIYYLKYFNDIERRSIKFIPPLLITFSDEEKEKKEKEPFEDSKELKTFLQQSKVIDVNKDINKDKDPRKNIVCIRTNDVTTALAKILIQTKRFHILNYNFYPQEWLVHVVGVIELLDVNGYIQKMEVVRYQNMYDFEHDHDGIVWQGFLYHVYYNKLPNNQTEVVIGEFVRKLFTIGVE